MMDASRNDSVKRLWFSLETAGKRRSHLPVERKLPNFEPATTTRCSLRDVLRRRPLSSRSMCATGVDASVRYKFFRLKLSMHIDCQAVGSATSSDTTVRLLQQSIRERGKSQTEMASDSDQERPRPSSRPSGSFRPFIYRNDV